MNGQGIVDLAETLTGRTSESDKMLTRINTIQKMLWSQHEWDFALEQAALLTDASASATGFSVQADEGIVHTSFWNTAASDNANRGHGNWIYVPADEVYIRLGQNSSTLVAYPEGIISTLITLPPSTLTWFRIDYSLERFALNGNNLVNSTRENYSRIINAWIDGADADLELVSLAEWYRRVPQMDINATGRPTFAAITHGWIQTLGAGSSSVEYKKGPVLRVWPIPDDVYQIHYNYWASPDDVTLTTTPKPNDDKWHQALAFGAAYLTRLDDVDATWQQFKNEYDSLVKDLTWTYKVTPNYAPRARGPRQATRNTVSTGYYPWR